MHELKLALNLYVSHLGPVALTLLPYALRVQDIAYAAGPGVPNAIAHTIMNYRIDLIGQISYVRTKPILPHKSMIFCFSLGYSSAPQ